MYNPVVKNGFGLKEAIAFYIQHKIQGEMAVKVDDLPDVIAIGRNGNRIVPILRPGVSITSDELMKRAGVRPSRKGAGGITALTPTTIIDIQKPGKKKIPFLQ